jgi:hypothetical protein
MKIFKSKGSKERLFEMMERVNKINIHEYDEESGNYNLDSNAILNMAFEELVNKKLNIEQSNTQTHNNETFIEIMCLDKQRNRITFTFKTDSSESDQENVYSVNNVILTNNMVMNYMMRLVIILMLKVKQNQK